jgi:hypothetical protein
MSGRGIFTFENAVGCEDRVNLGVGIYAMDANPDTIASALSQLAANGAGADRVAALAAEKMRAIHLALAPIIGDRGVSALYRRSLFLIARHAAWASLLHDDEGTSNDYAALQSAIAQQPSSDALKVTEALFETLYTVLVSLIGAALTERLLHPMFDTSSNGHAVQETPHE